MFFFDFPRKNHKLAKYFSGQLPNSQKYDISFFVKLLENIDIYGDFTSKYGAKRGGLYSDYVNLFDEIGSSNNGAKKILMIKRYFGLCEDF